MNVQLMKEFVKLAFELQDEGVFGFTVNFDGCEFHVSSELIENEPNLQIETRGDSTYPYQIYVDHGDVKIFALLKEDELKRFPQFKEDVKARLRKQLEELEEEETA